MANPPVNGSSSAREALLVLFISRTNTSISILAEAILRHRARGTVRAASAGDKAGPHVNLLTLECLNAHGIATAGLRAKPWGEFWGHEQLPVRMLITLGDPSLYAAGANWDHDDFRTVKAHWPTPDPETVVGSDTDRRLAFEEAFVALEARISKLIALPLEGMSDQVLSRELARIGEGSWLATSTKA